MSLEAVHALSRWGLGARPGERAEIESDPRGWVLQQLDAPADDALAITGQPTTKDQYSLRRRILELEDMSDEETEEIADLFDQFTDSFETAKEIRIAQGVATTNPVKEKIVRFWTNHFTVSARDEDTAPLAAQYEREAIRPHIDGKFYDLLIAAEQHPAMLVYLDQFQSVGPNSPYGLEEEAGLNENLAREIMELHTRGADADYTQQDVRDFAKVLTGWTIDEGDEDNNAVPGGSIGSFVFAPAYHEPGTKTILGNSYAESGILEGLNALRDFTRMPETAVFIATKLVRHFVSDTPSAGDIAAIADVFLETDGDLPSVYKALVGLESGWSNILGKARPIEDYIIALGRAGLFTGAGPGILPAVYDSLGQESYAPPGPNGYPDVASFWLSGQGVIRRAELAAGFAKISNFDPVDLLTDLFGPAFARTSLRAIRRSGSARNQRGVALACPEFLQM